MRRLKAYLRLLRHRGEAVPMRNGQANRSAIAMACGFDRQVLYKNPGAVAVLDEAVNSITSSRKESADGSPSIPTPLAPDDRDRRIGRLEQENASFRAEIAGLRDRLRRLQHVEGHMVETGRFVGRIGTFE